MQAADFKPRARACVGAFAVFCAGNLRCAPNSGAQNGHLGAADVHRPCGRFQHTCISTGPVVVQVWPFCMYRRATPEGPQGPCGPCGPFSVPGLGACAGLVPGLQASAGIPLNHILRLAAMRLISAGHRHYCVAWIGMVLKHCHGLYVRMLLRWLGCLRHTAWRAVV